MKRQSLRLIVAEQFNKDILEKLERDSRPYLTEGGLAGTQRWPDKSFYECVMITLVIRSGDQFDNCMKKQERGKFPMSLRRILPMAYKVFRLKVFIKFWYIILRGPAATASCQTSFV